MRTLTASLGGLAFLAAAAAPLPAMAYTQEDVQACSSDAMRLCSAFIPDEGRIAQCLFANRRQVSAACNARMSRPTAASRTTTMSRTTTTTGSMRERSAQHRSR